METRTLDLRPILVIAAVVAVALTVWAAGAFAAGGSSGSGDSPAGTPTQLIQTQDDAQPPSGEDCPEDGNRGGGGSGGSDGSGSSEL
jgi:hypothetical protein